MREQDKNNYRVFPIKHFFGSVSWCCRACDVNWTPSCSVVAGRKQQKRSSWGIVILGLSAKSLCVFMPLTLHIYLNMLASQDSCFLLSNAAAKVSELSQNSLQTGGFYCHLCYATVCKVKPVINLSDAIIIIIVLHNVHNANDFLLRARSGFHIGSRASMHRSNRWEKVRLTPRLGCWALKKISLGKSQLPWSCSIHSFLSSSSALNTRAVST